MTPQAVYDWLMGEVGKSDSETRRITLLTMMRVLSNLYPEVQR